MDTVNSTLDKAPTLCSTTSFLGTWQLSECYVSVAGSSERHYPLGRDAQGTIHYGESHMSVQIMKQGRPKYSGNNFHQGSVEEMAAAAEGYIAYTGHYSFDEETSIITHYVENSLNPSWVGTQQQRLVVLHDNVLELRPALPIKISGDKVYAALIWTRCEK